jgi:hypothetical protein
MKYTKNTNCPVCGFDLGFEPWINGFGSLEICPSCGIQFGYDDIAGNDLRKRIDIYVMWREKWLSTGPKWWSKNPQPEDWNPMEQLKNVPQ